MLYLCYGWEKVERRKDIDYQLSHFQSEWQSGLLPRSAAPFQRSWEFMERSSTASFSEGDCLQGRNNKGQIKGHWIIIICQHYHLKVNIFWKVRKIRFKLFNILTFQYSTLIFWPYYFRPLYLFRFSSFFQQPLSAPLLSLAFECLFAFAFICTSRFVWM
jgi:hypothetical protein